MKIILSDKSGSKKEVVRLLITESMIVDYFSDYGYKLSSQEEIDRVVDIMLTIQGGVTSILDLTLEEYASEIDEKQLLSSELTKEVKI